MEVNGRIKKLFETQTFSSGFKKRELVVTTVEQYPQDIIIEFVQDKIEALNGYNVGDEVKISINLRGREWINPEGVAKYFNSIVGWRIEKTGAAMPQHTNIAPTPDNLNDYGSDDDSDDLPF